MWFPVQGPQPPQGCQRPLKRLVELYLVCIGMGGLEVRGSFWTRYAGESTDIPVPVCPTRQSPDEYTGAKGWTCPALDCGSVWAGSKVND